MTRRINRKALLSMLMGAVLLIGGLSMRAYADEREGTKTWMVDFSGDKMTNNFRSDELADTIYEMQPGDAFSVRMNMTNSADFTTDWYITQKVIRTLEDTQEVAKSGGYTYKLVYVAPDDTETILYDSDSVGGEKETDTETDLTGLKEATDSLDEFFFLGRLAPGEAGRVDLSVSLDGESQGNVYQDTVADLQMNFAVEKVTDTTKTPKDTPSDHPTSVTKTSGNVRTARVKTGDIMLWGSIAAFAGGLVMIVTVIVLLKKRSREVQA